MFHVTIRLPSKFICHIPFRLSSCAENEISSRSSTRSRPATDVAETLRTAEWGLADVTAPKECQRLALACGHDEEEGSNPAPSAPCEARSHPATEPEHADGLRLRGQGNGSDAGSRQAGHGLRRMRGSAFARRPNRASAERRLPMPRLRGLQRDAGLRRPRRLKAPEMPLLRDGRNRLTCGSVRL